MAKNKTMAGYHVLMILSMVDNVFNAKEDMVIKEFLIEEFPDPLPINLDAEMEELSALSPSMYLPHFDKMLEEFYNESTPKERIILFEFAVSLIQADNEIREEENYYLNHMIKAWGLASS